MATRGDNSDGNNKPNRSRKTQVCRYYKTKNGCKAGDQCKFLHIDEQPNKIARTPEPGTVSLPMAPKQSQHQAPNAPPAGNSRAVPRPVPKAQTEDPRAFQIGQIQRRFKPARSEQNGITVLVFVMKPSDPDFPYEIETLECQLSVPTTYPLSGKPSLSIKNKDIPRGFQINIERGFESILADAPEATLLGVMNRLDRQLESILAGQSAQTVKIVSNKSQAPHALRDEDRTAESKERESDLSRKGDTTTSDQQRNIAQAKRQSDVRQFEARFGKLQSFKKSADGLTYTLPLDSPKRSTWPKPIQMIRSVQLTIPEFYPLETPEVNLYSECEEARAIETAFKQRSEESPEATITQQINYLSQHLKEMAVAKPKLEALTSTDVEGQSGSEATSSTNVHRPTSISHQHDKSHIHYIPRPPEWDEAIVGENTDDSESEDSDYDSAESKDGDEEETQILPSASAPAERGILLSFPNLELYGIELLELISLHITVKCDRCKESMDVERLRNSTEGSKMREESCKKCTNTLALRFRADMIHVNSVRAGYLDLDGCTVIDLLPSQYIPTCSECSTAYPAPGVVAVRGDTAMAICRECHRKMTMKILEVKFLRISASTIKATSVPGRKKTKENLGITAGTQLPRQGRCQHYRKSYRWFRFSCCSKVFACDRCHDEQCDHSIEHANRMICGYCSREQNYRPEDCGICHAPLTGKAGRGFWEGGRGTRDPARMSRKDPRKYRNRNKTKPRS